MTETVRPDKAAEQAAEHVVEEAGAHAEVVDICRQLLRFDTSNPGGTEAAATAYVADLLTEVGWSVTRVSAETGRDFLAVRIPGRDPSRPALLVHAHLDVVPVDE